MLVANTFLQNTIVVKRLYFFVFLLNGFGFPRNIKQRDSILLKICFRILKITFYLAITKSKFGVGKLNIVFNF